MHMANKRESWHWAVVLKDFASEKSFVYDFNLIDMIDRPTKRSYSKKSIQVNFLK